MFPRMFGLVALGVGGIVAVWEGPVAAQTKTAQPPSTPPKIMKINPPKQAPCLHLDVFGPQRRHLNKQAVYKLEILNTGDASASDVALQHVLPRGVRFVAASDDGKFDPKTNSVNWSWNDLAPGQLREVRVHVYAVRTGVMHHRVRAHSAEGLAETAELVTKVEGMSPIVVEVIDPDEPSRSEVNVYTVRISNTGNDPYEDVTLTCKLQEGMQLRKATGPSEGRQQGDGIVFPPLKQLMPKGEAVYRIAVQDPHHNYARHIKVRVNGPRIPRELSTDE